MDKLKEDFERIVREHKSTIYTVCYMFSKDEDEVQDLFQEALINLWRGFGSFKGEAKELKDNYNRWIKFAIPVTILWAVWFFYEIWRSNEDKHAAIILITCGAVGGLIGAAIGWRMHKKVVNTCDDIVRQIEE